MRAGCSARLESDRSDVHALGAGRREALWQRQQHLRPGRARRVNGPRLQERILIVSLRATQSQGKGIVEAALDACRLRLRPIVMTSVPHRRHDTAGALARAAPSALATGVTVFSGMIGSPCRTVPDAGFYVGLRNFRTQAGPQRSSQS